MLNQMYWVSIFLSKCINTYCWYNIVIPNSYITVFVCHILLFTLKFRVTSGLLSLLNLRSESPDNSGYQVSSQRAHLSGCSKSFISWYHELNSLYWFIFIPLISFRYISYNPFWNNFIFITYITSETPVIQYNL